MQPTNAHGWATEELKRCSSTFTGPRVELAQAWAILALAEAINNLTFPGSCDVAPIAESIDGLGRELCNLRVSVL